jgi:hypothetical protein
MASVTADSSNAADRAAFALLLRTATSTTGTDGAAFYPPLELHEFADTGSRGVASSQPVAAGTALFHAPERLALVASRARAHLPSAAAAWTACKARPRCHPPVAALIVQLLELRAKFAANGTSFAHDSEEAAHQAYMRLLPAEFDDHLVNWPLLSRASPYFSLFSTRSQYLAEMASQQIIDELFDTLRSTQPALFDAGNETGAFGTDAVRWAWRAVSSRSFGWSDKESNTSATADAADEDASADDMAMLPLIDMMNHRHDAPVVARGDRHYSLRAHGGHATSEHNAAPAASISSSLADALVDENAPLQLTMAAALKPHPDSMFDIHV